MAIGLLTGHKAVEDLKLVRQAKSPSWIPTLVSLLPLWLVALAVTAEGFPRPPISIELAAISLGLALGIGIVLLWQGQMTLGLLLVCFLPFLFLPTFDEISTTYKTPFILLCALILTAGIVGHLASPSHHLGRWLILVFAVAVTVAMAHHATFNYWDMVGNLGYVRCLPDAHGCPPLTGQETPWWILFFGP
jgi:hypothetical protein